MAQRFGGRYELVQEIGAGGMGRVFEAIDVETGRIVATKVMLATGELELQALLRFQQEGAVLATLSHPNIVTVYGTFLEEQMCAIVMERLDGSSLRALLERERPSLLQSKQIAAQVLSALEYAHARGIVHRDIKPDNIMVLEDGRVKVTDFGIARVLQPGNSLITATGTTLGTPLYMSPELIEGTKADGRTDIYSLGVVLYQMSTGRPPFEGDEPLTIAFKHVHKAPQPPRELNGALPESWDAVILKALAKDPADRYQTAAAMRRAMEPLPTDAGVEVTTPLAAAKTRERAPSDEVPPERDPGAAVADPQKLPSSPAQPGLIAAPSAPQRATAGNEGTKGRLWAVLGGIAAVLVIAGSLIVLTHLGSQGSSATSPVSVTFAAASGAALPTFRLRKETENQGRTITPNGSTAKLRLAPGRYLLSFPQSTIYLDSARVAIRAAGSQTIRLDALFGKLKLLPAAGRVAVPGFDLLDLGTGKSRHGVDETQASQGVYLRPGRYRLSPWPGEYPSSLLVRVRAHDQTTVNLARRYGRLTVVQLAGAPPSGFDLLDPGTNQSRAGLSADQGAKGAFVPVGHYRLHFYYSDAYPDLVDITITPGGESRADLNMLFAEVRVPAVSRDYSVTYTWREGDVTRTFQARTKPHTYYIRAGTYALQVEAQGSTRVTTVHAALGKVTTLPTQ